MKILIITLLSCVAAFGQLGDNGSRVISGTLNYCATASASATAYACNFSPALTAYKSGGTYSFKADTINTGSATINLNSLGAKTMKTMSGGDLTAAMIKVDTIVQLRYDGTNMQCLNCFPPRVITATFDGGGLALTAGTTVIRHSTAQYSCTIVGWNIGVDAGTATFKLVRLAAAGTALPTISNSINTSGIAISTGTYFPSSTVSDFTSTAITAGDKIGVNLSAVATATLATLNVICQ